MESSNFEFDRIEAALRAQAVSPADDLRPRVLAAMSEEFGSTRCPSRGSRRERSASREAWLALATAGVLVWVHLSWSATLRTRWAGALPVSANLNLAVDQMRDLVPDLSAEEARRMAILWHAVERG